MGAIETLGKIALKMKILSFKKPDFSSPMGAMPLTINPENYTIDYRIAESKEQGWGVSGHPGKYYHTERPTFTVDFLFDSSGIIDGLPRPTVAPEVELLKKFLLDYIGSEHDTPYVIVTWGSFIFKGKCQTLNITYKLFSPEGLPTRVSCKATFTGNVVDLLRVAEEAASSPDLTHYRVVKDGDNLPQMCYDIYGDARHYIQVAKANKLPNFRKMKTGTELFFPPISKTTEA